MWCQFRKANLLVGVTAFAIGLGFASLFSSSQATVVDSSPRFKSQDRPLRTCFEHDVAEELPDVRESERERHLKEAIADVERKLVQVREGNGIYSDKQDAHRSEFERALEKLLEEARSELEMAREVRKHLDGLRKRFLDARSANDTKLVRREYCYEY